jgi:5-methylcytosine-specific restriction endonuclease McrA
MPNKDPILYKAYQKQYREKHRDALNEYLKTHRVENLEKVREIDRLRAAHKRHEYREEVNAYHRIYTSRPEFKAKDLARRLVNNHNYRARRKGAIGKFTLTEWNDLLFQYGNKCLCCQTREKLTADHVIPLANGGSNAINNIQPLCRSCNSSKGIKTTDYRRKICAESQ